MIKRTFIDKSNTIFEGSNENFGLNPISMLNYGLVNSRVLIHFDMENIREFIKKCPENAVVKHTLKMTNCGSIDFKNFSKPIPSNDINGLKKRATSFTIYAYPIPNNADSFKSNGYIDWDEGVGFDSNSDIFISGDSSLSNEGSSWFNRRSGLKWQKSGSVGESYNELSGNYIAKQNFDHGNEDLELDITEYVNAVLSDVTEKDWDANNDGLCLIIDPKLDVEKIEDYDYNINDTKYVGFFNNKTNTFFAPYVESRCWEYIKDDRYNFIQGATNRLFLYLSQNNEFVDIETSGITCDIDGVPYEVKKFSNGIYYIEVDSGVTSNYDSDMIYDDVWRIDGDMIVQDFVVHPKTARYGITPDAPEEEKYEPSLSGMNDNEILNDGEIRKIDVKYRIPYSRKYKTLNNTEYRIYTKDGGREIDVIEWDGIHNGGKFNFFIIESDGLVSGKYYVDIRVNNKYEKRVFRNVLRFSKENNVTKITH